MNCYIFILLSILFYTVSPLSLETLLKEDIMFIGIEEESFPINLIENPVTRELISILPLKIRQIQNDSKTIKMPLKAYLETIDLVSSLNSTDKANKGDVFIYKGKEIIISNEYTTLNGDKEEYIKIGTCKNTEDLLKKITKNKSIFLWNTLNYENNKGKVKPYGKYNSIMNYFTWKIFTFFCFVLI